MKKFLPAIFLFIITFLVVIIIQVGTQTITAADSKKDLKGNDLYEQNYLTIGVQDLNSKKIKLSQIKSKVVIVNFWASWCLPCLEEMPSLINLKKKYGEKELTVFAINTDEVDQIKNIEKTKQKLNLKNEFVVVADKNTQIAELFKITAIPVTIIFKDGKVVHVSNGPMDFNSGEFLEKMQSWIK